MNTETKYQKAFSVLERIHASGMKAEAMSTDELVTAVAELKLEGGERIYSLESAVKGEACHRLKHPFIWRFLRWKDSLNRHAY